jgi:precorrin-2 dehydrogenase/sirohydrochlorin ferrochelatase
MLPLYFNLNEKRILIIGGGQIGLRRCKKLLREGCNITVLSPEFHKGFKELESRPQITLIQDKYRPFFLKNQHLVLAATNIKEKNEEIYNDCQLLGIFCSRVDNHEQTDFIVPGVMEKGDLMIAVSTGGASPTLTKKILEQFEKKFDDEYIKNLEWLKNKRKEIIENQTISEEEKIRQLQQLVQWEKNIN